MNVTFIDYQGIACPMLACSTKLLRVYTSLYRQRTVLCDKAKDPMTHVPFAIDVLCSAVVSAFRLYNFIYYFTDKRSVF